MSEHQYYEFRAVDRPLTKGEMSELRNYSTRATITSTSFTNVYNWGSFKGSPREWMKRYFDAFLYTANWGTRILMLRIPEKLFDTEQLALYTGCEAFDCSRSDGNVVLEFYVEEAERTWMSDEGRLDGLIPMRDELMRGDLRALYLGWLMAAQEGEIEPDEEEPRVPPGLKNLTKSQKGLVQFFEIDKDLIAVAAENSPDMKSQDLSDDEIELWVATLPESEKNELVIQLIQGNHLHLSMELRNRIVAETRTEEIIDEKPRRTVGEMLERASKVAEERERLEAEKKARERAEHEKQEAEARKKHLESLDGKEDGIWDQVFGLVETRQPKKYDEAVDHLIDLRDLAVMKGQSDDFQKRLGLLYHHHKKKSTFVDRVREKVSSDIVETYPTETAAELW